MPCMVFTYFVTSLPKSIILIIVRGAHIYNAKKKKKIRSITYKFPISTIHALSFLLCTVKKPLYLSIDIAPPNQERFFVKYARMLSWRMYTSSSSITAGSISTHTPGNLHRYATPGSFFLANKWLRDDFV